MAAMCRSCRFYHASRDGSRGLCRRSPPSAAKWSVDMTNRPAREAMNAYPEGVWPSVSDTAWCGEYRSRHTPAGRAALTEGTK